MNEEQYHEAVEQGARLNARLIRERVKPDCPNDYALAAAVNASPHDLRRWLNGCILPDLSHIRRIAGAACCCASELLVFPEGVISA